jgi:hypothetical protein
MTVYKTTLATALTKAAPSDGGQPITVYAELALTALANADTIQMIPIPNGARVLDWTLGADDLDSNGTPTITLGLGDSGSSTRYVSASTIAQTGAAPVNTLLKTGFGYIYTADDMLTITVSAAIATFQAGTVRASLTYVI